MLSHYAISYTALFRYLFAQIRLRIKVTQNPDRMPSEMTKRVVLFLQGPPSRFWVELADAIEAGGGQVRRVNLCAGDLLYWRRSGATNFRGRFRIWRRWLRDYVRREAVTDIIYFADRLPYHRIAALVARAEGIEVHSVEFGYLRPDWLTIEAVAGGAYSRFPDTFWVIRKMAAPVPEPDMNERYLHHFGREAVNEVVYNLALVFGRPLFPFYWSDKYYAPALEYLRWIPKLISAARKNREAGRIIARHLAAKVPYTLVALQMQNDYQIRKSSGFRHQSEMLEGVIKSFAGTAPSGHRLLVKLHPLDSGWENWPRRIARIAVRFGTAGRIDVVDGGDLGKMIASAHGIITINSTVGIHALRAGRPVKVLGAAIYELPGLTHRGGLDSFWNEPETPDGECVRCFLSALAAEIQVKGSFYNLEGRRVAVAEMAIRILEGRVGPREQWRVTPPPRLRKLRRQSRSRTL